MPMLAAVVYVPGYYFPLKHTSVPSGYSDFSSNKQADQNLASLIVGDSCFVPSSAGTDVCKGTFFRGSYMTNVRVGELKKMSYSPSHSPVPMMARSSSINDVKHMDMLMPHVKDVPQFSSAAFGNTVFQVGTPPKKEQAERLVPSSLFGFGKPTLPDVVQAGDPILHEPAAEVPLKDIGSPEIEKIINDLVSVMRTAPGVGLAAPQIGVPLQIIVLEDTQMLMSYSSPEEVEQQQRRPFELVVIINPKLSPVGDESALFFEGCLSVEGYRALVERHLEVEVSGLDRTGKPITVRAKGWQARILQHECDHLQGLLYVDKMVPRTFRTTKNLRLPLPSGCPQPGVCADFEMEMT